MFKRKFTRKGAWNLMKPTKTVTAKKKPAKRKNNPMVEKLLKLKYRINDVYHLIKEGNGKPEFDLTMLGDTRIDKNWVMTLISDVENNDWITIPKEDMLKCNGLWRKYA